MKAITVHGAGATDAFSARPPEGESRVDVILNVGQGIKVHGGNLGEVDVVADIFRLVVGILGIVFVYQKSFHGLLLSCGEGLIKFNYIVRVHVSFHS